jgi:hypothetical protein
MASWTHIDYSIIVAFIFGMGYTVYMGQCKCGYSTEYPDCNGTHKIVKAVKEDIIKQLEDIDIDGGKLNALGFKMLAIEAIRSK